MVCACCGYSADKKDPTEISLAIELTRLERSVFDLLASRFGRQVTRTFILDAMYGDDPNGGPENATNVLHVVKCRLRKKIAPYGLDIITQQGRWANGIRMVWAAA